MNERFNLYLKTTKGFFLVRLAFAIAVSVVYLLIAAGIQYLFTDMFGETTFNYIVGGLLSLFISVVCCNYIGSIAFMFVKGWHVAALAYVDQLDGDIGSAVGTGVKVFSKHLISFGAVYGLRLVLNNLIEVFKTRLWEILGDTPLSQIFSKIAEHPIAAFLAKDILSYGFDATIFYIVSHDDVNESVTSQAFTAVKKYLCCLPSIMMTSIKVFLLFDFLPKIVGTLVLLYLLIFKGFVVTILASVLLYPLFYLAEKVIFDPLIVMMFISVYSEHCEDSEEDKDIEDIIDSILEEQGLIEKKSSQKKKAKSTKTKKENAVPTSVENIEEIMPELPSEEILEASKPNTEPTVDVSDIIDSIEVEIEDETEVSDDTEAQEIIKEGANLRDLMKKKGLSALSSWKGNLDSDPLPKIEIEEDDGEYDQEDDND